MKEYNGIWSTGVLLAVSEYSGFSNWFILGCYLAVLVSVGIYFAKREKSTDVFFLAGRRIPWWVAGLSIFGIQLSAITYLAMSARAYAMVAK
jgi:Na+/proline symporter